MMINIVSFSGGRTSAYLIAKMEQRRKEQENFDVAYIFMDTGAEHSATYHFIRKVVANFNINLTCLRVKMTPKLGQSNTYEVIPLENLQPDYQVFQHMFNKYGTPYFGGAFCTDRLKTTPYKKYCNDTFGRNNYTTWLGIRCDEPNRLSRQDRTQYLADISNATKLDILTYWHNMPFDLDIEEHLGNCVLCIKKSVGKIALACRDAPEHANKLLELIYSPKTRMPENRQGRIDIMYRGRHSLTSIIETYRVYTRDEIYQRLKMSKQIDYGQCSESCEIDL